MDVYWFWASVASFLSWILIRFLSEKQKERSRDLKLPPGPRAWPVIGHLHLASKLNPRGLRELSQKHGPIFLLRLGQVKTVVVSSAEIAKTILKTQDQAFSDRPSSSASENLCYGSADISFSRYDDRWRLLRKIATTHLLGSNAVKSLLPFIEGHVCKVLVDPILEASKNSETPQVEINLSQVLIKLLTSLLSETVLGNEDWEGAAGLKALSHEYSYLLATPDIGDFLPWLAWLDLLGLRRRQKSAAKKADEIYGKVITDHAAHLAEKKRPDFVDALLHYEAQIGTVGMKVLITDMLHAGTDTTYATLEWAMSELLRHPQDMSRVQAEIRSVVGPGRQVSHDDVARLPYLRAVVKETLRLHTPVPLLLPRQARVDCHVGGYSVPRGSTVLINVWAMARDSAVWGPRAEEFWPDRFRFMDKDKDNDEEMFWPFGAGRRACPGMLLGLSVVELVMAQMLHFFDWTIPLPLANSYSYSNANANSCDLDMSDTLTLVLQRATPLLAVATPHCTTFVPRNA